MSEEWFEEFGAALDSLWSIMRNADDDVERAMKGAYEELNDLYYDIKDMFGYTDASDEG